MPHSSAPEPVEPPAQPAPAEPPELARLPRGALQGREAFRQAVRDDLACAAAHPARFSELLLCDPDFADWPLGERPVVEHLQAWALRGQGRLTLLAGRYDELQRQAPLFVHWRRQWSHKIEARACPPAAAADLPGALCTPAWALRRFSPLHSVCVAGPEAERRVTLRAELDDWLTRSTSAFPATVLGL